LNVAIQNECYTRTRQCCNILTLVPVCTIVLRYDKDINYCRFMARCMARVAPLITVTIPGSSGASRSINCDLLFHRKSLFIHRICSLNASARLIYCALKSCPITPLLRELHWLPVCYCFEYKILPWPAKFLHSKGVAAWMRGYSAGKREENR